MRQIIYGINYSPEPVGIGKYTTELAEFLAGKGIDVIVITGYPYYPDWRISENYKFRRYFYSFEVKNNVRIIRCPIFLTGRTDFISRILVDFSFLITSIPILIFLLIRFYTAVVTAISPSFLPIIFTSLFVKNMGRWHLHIQDFQLSAAANLGFFKSQYLSKFLEEFEFKVISKFPLVSSISRGMKRKIDEKLEGDSALIPNWYDEKVFFPLGPDERRIVRERLNWKVDEKVLFYSGSLGEKQGLFKFMELFGFIQNKNYKVVIQGKGPYFKQLMDFAFKNNFTGIEFFDFCSEEELNFRINAADGVLLFEKPEAGNLLSPSKLIPILAAGGLILTDAATHSGISEHVSTANAVIIHEGNVRDLLTEFESHSNEEIEMKRKLASEICFNGFGKLSVLNKYCSLVNSSYEKLYFKKRGQPPFVSVKTT